MKTHLHSSPTSSGSTLLVALFMVGLLGALLIGYLSMISSSHKMTARSEAWHYALMVAEAGAEEALSHLEENGVNKTGSMFAVTDLKTQGWTEVNGKIYVRRAMDTAYYEVTIAAGVNPIITSTGFVPAPTQVSSAGGPFMALVAPWDSGQAFISRSIEVRCRAQGRFTKALVGRDKVELNGKNVSVDSFHSYDVSGGTWDGTNIAGGVYDIAKRRDSGDVAVIKGLTDVMKVSKATVRGRLSTGPNGNIKLDDNALVGSLDWVSTHTAGVQPGWSADDSNFDLPSVVKPFTVGLTPISGWVGTNYYDHILTSGDFVVNDFKGSVLVAGQARLLVTDKVEFSEDPKDNHGIEFNPGARLEMYVEKGDAKLVGKKDKKKGPSVKMYLNGEGNATNFFYFGLPNHKKLEIKNMDDFTGIVYAPDTEIHIKAGSLKYYHCIVFGAVMGKTITLEKNVDFHYDENISNLAADSYVVESWREL